MATEFRLPDIGEGVAEGEIVKWHVKPGDHVKEDQPMVEVMTDKVTAEIPSPYTGVVKELRAKEGEVVKVGAVLIVFDEVGGASATPAKEEAVREPAAVGVAPAQVSQAVAATAINGKHAQAQQTAIPARGDGGKVLAAPATRKLARQMGLDLTLISGSGPRGRVTPDDVRQASQGGGATPPMAAPQVITSGMGAVAPTQLEERKPFGGIRKRIAEHLTKSKQVAPHFAYVEEVDMTEIVRMREQLAPHAEAQGVRLSFLPFIIKAVITGLKQFPVLNSSLDEVTQELVYKHYYNMGIAVATDQGLIVPVIKNADQKGILQLGREIKNLAERGRSGKLNLEEMRGGTFTLTSIGSIGGLFGFPIINHPEVGIMGINKISKRPVVKTVDGVDQIVIREMMHLSLSCDHRVVDGAEAALFTKRVIELLENPALLMLD